MPRKPIYIKANMRYMYSTRKMRERERRGERGEGRKRRGRGAREKYMYQCSNVTYSSCNVMIT